VANFQRIYTTCYYNNIIKFRETDRGKALFEILAMTAMKRIVLFDVRACCLMDACSYFVRNY